MQVSLVEFTTSLGPLLQKTQKLIILVNNSSLVKSFKLELDSVNNIILGLPRSLSTIHHPDALSLLLSLTSQGKLFLHSPSLTLSLLINCESNTLILRHSSFKLLLLFLIGETGELRVSQLLLSLG